MTLTLISIVTDFPTWICFLALLVGWGAFSQRACSSGSRVRFARAVCGWAGASRAFCSRFVRPSLSRESLPVRREPPVLGRGGQPPYLKFSLDQGVSYRVVRHGLSCDLLHVLRAFVLQRSVCHRPLVLGDLLHELLLVPVVWREDNINDLKILCFLVIKMSPPQTG